MVLSYLNIIVLLARRRPVQFPEGVGREDVVVVPVYEVVSPGQLQGQAGHQARGDVLRYETRRVDTGVQQLARGGRGEDGEGGVREVRQRLGGQMVDQDPAP